MSGFEWYAIGVLLMLGNAFFAGTQPLLSKGASVSAGIAVGIAVLMLLKLHSLSAYL